MLLSPAAIEEVVRDFDELGDEYEVVVERMADRERITLKIETKPHCEGNQEEIVARLQNQLRLSTNLGYQIEVHPFGSLTRYEVKARRFKDRRKTS